MPPLTEQARLETLDDILWDIGQALDVAVHV